jgi:uncharacterized protein (TIGR02996 family)
MTQSLIDAVHANLDDDAPRLVLADALQSRGDPQGELIAVQVKLARLAPDSPERDALGKQEKRLLRDPTIASRTAEARKKYGIVVGWGRGFICDIGMSGHLLPKTKVFREIPTIEGLELDGCIACDGGANVPELARLRRLSNAIGTAVHVSHLDMPILARLEQLAITGAQLDKHIGAIVAFRHLRPRVLDLTKTNIKRAGAETLAAAALKLERLVLAKNHIDEAGRSALRKAYGDRVVLD